MNSKNDTFYKNIYLRSIKKSDIKSYYLNWLENKKVNKYLETRFEKQSLNKIANYILKSKKEGSILYAICLIKNDKHIGNIKIGSINKIHKTAYLSYFIGETSEWGKGYATEAVKVALKISFLKLGLFKCYAGVYLENKNSSKVLKKAGFKKEATFKLALKNRASRDDQIIYSIMKNKYIK